MPNFPQAHRAPVDDIDRAILRVLAENARTPNNALAEAVGIAPSTCLARVRTLRERGIIRAFRTEIDPAAIGLPLQAMISVRLRAHTREQNESFRSTAPDLPGVLAVFHMAGSDDYLLHVGVAGPEELRDFVVDHLTTHPAVAQTRTNLIFEQIPGRRYLTND
ncbi:Lrp/AsnC family transcriptional regulator [Kitasatospora purpeofusca]|uniref:Lrp/AsnC family transcriptional regulator n=1 Tax=Kitasatospora purpeofusca TaxID=67352 RepID=A0ABZ1U112_9ACTN|nr:Lrp/AsnC family transcriptional regulator [Kitasatospora purpeofusca]MCX4754187.1 Lrp/AsnC family transcriptional regulator [Kitasatospora purpeofusca]WSR33624.1 Lrp/AsnC family transcriptional regulator [Kitasatospora purpeofusca]WSR41725.1 Lrp/AsnC family transcriptional regulator [Kitasatospora purpeofusca]